MRHLTVCLAALALTSLFTLHLSAAPGDREFINSVNLSGGTNLNGVQMRFNAPTIINIPGIVQAGTYDVGGLVNAGTYYYYPLQRQTVFSGTFRGAPLPPGAIVTTSGVVLNDLPGGGVAPPAGSIGNVLGSAVITGVGGVDGTHTVSSP